MNLSGLFLHASQMCVVLVTIILEELVLSVCCVLLLFTRCYFSVP